MGVWAEQPAACFDQAVLDTDGLLVEASGPCKAGRGSAHDGAWGDHALVLTLASARTRGPRKNRGALGEGVFAAQLPPEKNHGSPTSLGSWGRRLVLYSRRHTGGPADLRGTAADA